MSNDPRWKNSIGTHSRPLSAGSFTKYINHIIINIMLPEVFAAQISKHTLLKDYQNLLKRNLFNSICT